MKKIEPFKVKLSDKAELCEPSEELVCDERSINKDLKEQPSWYAWYAVLQEKADTVYSQAKLLLEITEAQLDADIRLNANEKLTEKKIANMIVLSDDYQKAKMEVIEWKEIVGKIKAIKEGFQHRKDSLIALASNMRIQADPEIYLKKQELSDKDQKGTKFPG